MSVDVCVLFCGDPLAPRRVDPYFAAQAEIVRGLGGQVAVIDHDALLAGRAEPAVRTVPRDSGAWWYRGWMIPSARYSEITTALRARGADLRVTPRRYRAAHELPGWYATFSNLTAQSAWEDQPLGRPYQDHDAEVLASWVDANSAIVKDFVKSRKHEWADACYLPDLTDHAHVRAVVNRMLELQGDDLAGGVVIRAFEEYRPGEARVWWVDGEPVLVTAHPDTPDVLPQPDLAGVAIAVAGLGHPFVTTDLALRSDGVWRVVEVGDGQVSDLPTGVDPTPLLAKLATVRAGGAPGGPLA
ncbi:MAG TPA: ATP-grasp domain-containing protein [Micromonosporaceae bacterium]